jgi:hypothetical protein
MNRKATPPPPSPIQISKTTDLCLPPAGFVSAKPAGDFSDLL